MFSLMRLYPSKSLFITYDGLLDPLGSSQILPYLKAISAHQSTIYVISFEKWSRYKTLGSKLRIELEQDGIKWYPLRFSLTSSPFAKVWDLLRMYLIGISLVLLYRPLIVHTRSHVPGQVGLLLKCLFGLKLIFDCRGLWADERVDKRLWSLTNPIHQLQFNFYKKLERYLFAYSDHVVVLTTAFQAEALRLGVPSLQKLSVIPCCADFNHFVLPSLSDRVSSRESLGIPHTSIVLGYLGSVGSMYMPNAFLNFFTAAFSRYSDVFVLAITPDATLFRHHVETILPHNLQPFVHIVSASRSEVPILLSAVDVLVAFVKPGYARVSMSPTKLAESWACGIPTLCNYGVGDVDSLIAELSAGDLVDVSDPVCLYDAVTRLPQILQLRGSRLRNAARHKVSLDCAAHSYNTIYKKLKANHSPMQTH